MKCSLGCLFVISVASVHSSFQKPSGCGTTFGCFSDCEDKGVCTYMISWTSDNVSVTFTILSELPSSSNYYASIGFSPTQSMDEASVSSCLMTGSGNTFSYENSYNDGHKNSLVTNPQDGISLLNASYNGGILNCTFNRLNVNNDTNVFDLVNDYYMLYCIGPVNGGLKMKHSKRSVSAVKVDLQTYARVEDGNPTRVKAHGSLGIIAWILFMNLGNIIARHYKPLWSGKLVLGSAVWFLIHRICMLTGAVLTIVAFSIIIHGCFCVGDSNFERAHPKIGTTIFCIVIINPILGFFRPKESSKFRPIFYLFHYLFGLSASVLSSINIFIGVQLKEAATSGSAFFVLIGFEVYRIIMIIIWEVILAIEKNKQKNSESKYIVKGATEMTGKGSKPEQIPDIQPYAWKTKKIMLCVHVFMSVTFALVLMIIVVTSKSSG